MNNVNLAATLILFLSALSCIFVANYSSYKMLRRVNSELPESVRAGGFWFDFTRNSGDANEAKSAPRTRRFRRAGVSRVKSRALLLMAIASSLACAWQLGFFDFLLSK